MNHSKKSFGLVFTYLIIFIIGLAMLYPVIWMFFATFKSNSEIFGSIRLFPSHLSLESFIKGWRGTGDTTYTDFFINTFLLVVPTTLFTVLISSFVAYGFARFRFPGKKILFSILISTLMLPNAVIIIPRYVLFNQFQWIDTYMPFYMPALLACHPFFVFMMVQFMRGLPIELDESAYIDGCGSFRIFLSILMPLLKPALFSAGLFQFMWTYNDYFNTLIFINSVTKYPISLALRMSLDSESVVQWNVVMAMAFVAVTPLMIMFFAAQKYFVEGLATTGLKG